MDIIFKIFNYNDVDYIVKENNQEYKFYYEENNQLIELIDKLIVSKLTMLLKLAMR
ncbi:MAG: hypothetical protein II625_07320 [Bacilli bacterium]|nr:hypothetical protein [Bacilli bacterium]